MTASPQVELPELLVRGVIASMQASSQENTRGWADALLRAVDFDAEALAARLSESEARAEGDARRYRWLRDEYGLSRLPYDDHGLGPDYPTGHDLDAAIDAAIAQEAEREAASA